MLIQLINVEQFHFNAKFIDFLVQKESQMLKAMYIAG
jgi:hypothetical protein